MRVRVEIPDRPPVRHEQDGRVGAALAELDESPARPLPEQLRLEMEARFGSDFSEVRIHQDARADSSAEALGARAFTVGNHIFFRAGAFEPGKVDGKRLLAHELAHTLQQPATPGESSALSPASRATAELHARSAAEAALTGKTLKPGVRGTQPHIARWLDSLPVDRATQSPVNPFVEELALDVVRALQRDPDDTGAHTQRRLARLQNGTRGAVIARARELLTPPEQEKSAKALSGAAVVEEEQPKAPPTSSTGKPAPEAAPAPESDVEQPMQTTPTPGAPSAATKPAEAPKPAEAAKPAAAAPTAKLASPTGPSKRPSPAVPGAAPAPAKKPSGEKPLTEAAAKAAAEGPPEFAKKLGGRPAEEASPAAAAAQAEGGDAGAQPDLGPAGTLEEKVDARERERLAKAEARAKEIEKHGVDEGEHKGAELAHAAPAEAAHSEAVATLETVAGIDAGGEPETPTAAEPEAIAAAPAPENEPPAEAPLAAAAPERAEPEPAAAEPHPAAAESTAAEPEQPAAEPTAAEPEQPAAEPTAAEPEPPAAEPEAIEPEPLPAAVAAPEPAPVSEPAPAPEPAQAPEPAPAGEAAPTVEPAPAAEAEPATRVADAAPAVESEASSAVRDETPAGEEPASATDAETPDAEAATPTPEAGEAPPADATATEDAAGGGADRGTDTAPAGDGGDCGPDSAPGVGGGEGGGAPIPDPQPEPEPDVSQATPEDAMATAATLAPGPLVRTLGGVKTAAQNEVAGKRDDLRANPPSIERPTGAPQTRDGRVTAAVKLGGGLSPAPAKPRRSQSPTPVPKTVAKQLPPAPPSPIQAVEPPRVNTATQTPMTPQEIQAFFTSMGQLPVTDPGLNVTAGPPPTVDLSGPADPTQVTEKRVEKDQEVDQAARDGEQAAAEPMGENNVYPAVKPEILRAEPTAAAAPAAAAPAAAAPAAAGPAGSATPAATAGAPTAATSTPVPASAAAGTTTPGGPDPAEIIAKEQSTAEVQAAAVDGQGQMAAGRDTQERGVDKANADAQADIDKQVADNSKAQDEQRKQTQSQVGTERSGWSKEQRDAVSKHSSDSDEQMRRIDKEVTGPRDQANKDAATQIDKGNAEAAQARRDGEAKAAAAREEGKKRGHGGVIGWIADKAKAAFNWVKDRIKDAFDWARKLVRDAINRAIKFATDIIDRVRNAIVSAIRAIGDALLALGDALLSWFPGLHERYRKAIHKLVDAAVAKVDELADGLKAAVRKVLTALLNAIEAVIALYERALLAAVSFVERAAMAVINKARAFVEMLAQWGQLIVDIASDPFQWLANLGSSAKDGIKNHLWRAFKCAVKAWFRSKVEEVLGLPLTLFALLKRGGIKMAEIAHMVWEGLKAAIPGILIELAIEKIVAMIVPAAGAIMAIIEGLRAAWGTIQRIIAAFEKFFAFLKAVKLGNAGRQFAEMIAAAAIVVLDFLANFLVQKLLKPAKPIGGRLAEIGKKIMARLGQVGKVIARGVRRAAQAVKTGVKKAVAAIRKGAAAIKQAAQKAARAVAKVAGRVGRTLKRGVGKVVAAVRKGAGRAMRAIERRFPRVAGVLRKGAALVRRLGRGVRRKWRRAKAVVRKQRRQFRRWRQKRRKRRAESATERLGRAERELPPKIHALIGRGVSGARLFLTLQYWRVAYRLSSLSVAHHGGAVIGIRATVNPSAELVQAYMPRGAVLVEIIRQSVRELMRHPEVKAAAEQQRANLGATEDAPVAIRGAGFLGQVVTFRRIAYGLSRFRQQAGGRLRVSATRFYSLLTGRRPVREWQGSLFNRNAFVSIPGARGGSYVNIANDLAATGKNDRALASGIRQIVSQGRLPGDLAEHGDLLAGATALMFGRESVRSQTNVAMSAMTVDLVERGDMTFRETFTSFEGTKRTGGRGAFPMSMVGAQRAAAWQVNQAAHPGPAPTTKAGRLVAGNAIELAHREEALADRWLRVYEAEIVGLMVAEGGEAFENEADGRRRVAERVKEFIKHRVRGFYGIGQGGTT